MFSMSRGEGEKSFRSLPDSVSIHKQMDRLTPKEQRFVDEYLVDANGTRSAIAAGYSPNTARSTAVEILAKPNIARAMAERQLALRQKVHVRQEDVLREACRIAFSDIRNVADFGENGVRFFNSEELSEDAARTIAEVTSKTRTIAGRRKDDEGFIEVERKVKMYDKLRALELVAKIIGAIAPPGTQNIGTQQNLTLPSGTNVEDLIRLRDDLRKMTNADS